MPASASNVVVSQPTMTSGSRMVIPAHSMAGAENISVGKALACSANDPAGRPALSAVYRYMGSNIISWYPTTDIATAWDPTADAPTAIDCSGLVLGPTLSMP